ncbi:hypothetical protein PHPALM_11429 [Phytophthora palmivora]|uniref:Myb/SANT-like domain-containing protein n=1 Tax=Phytophthora palmivora TaxID=4796 RepID=A0A2P4Y2K3_9STRA|nr:hypothetical protein PHPALM_11429 [Phytophthora palmivora]
MAAPRASWNEAKGMFLIESMTYQARAGKRSDSGFKKEAWVAVTAAINQKFGLELVKQQIKSRLQTLKGKYTAVSGMLSASGFGWDPVRNVVLVHDDVWEDYVKGNPKCVDYRQTPLTYYNVLVELFEGIYATGEHAITSTAREMLSKFRILGELG